MDHFQVHLDCDVPGLGPPTGKELPLIEDRLDVCLLGRKTSFEAVMT